MVADPLVSCVMPTWNRRSFIPAAIDCWMKQTYENRELVILDDGEEPIEDLIPDDPRILYAFDQTHRNTGEKRNRVNGLAQGEIICNWDDDDWSAPDRIQFQVDLLRSSQKPMTGFSSLLFWDLIQKTAKKFTATINGYVCGTTLCHTKEFWQMHPYKPIQQCSDNNLVYPNLKNIAASNEVKHMVARIHNCHHTSPKTGIKAKVALDSIPAEFWENEKLRLSA
jgi:glycosyltransferase involved in cell wall biosynthesis